MKMMLCGVLLIAFASLNLACSRITYKNAFEEDDHRELTFQMQSVQQDLHVILQTEKLYLA